MGTRSSARLFIRSLARSLIHLLAPDPILVGQTVLNHYGKAVFQCFSSFSGFKEEENGFPIPAHFNAKRYKEWPRLWSRFFRRKALPAAVFPSSIDESFNFFEVTVIHNFSDSGR